MRKLPVLFVVLVLSAAMAIAQGTTSRISGTVTDSTGAVVPNATVSATNDATGVSYTTHSSGAGTYAFDSLQIGSYTVKVDAPGFQEFVSTGNVLAIGVPSAVNPQLRAGSETQTVTVNGGYSLVQTESSGNFGGIIDSVTMTQLPIVGVRGRNPVGFVQYIPGVIQNNSGNAAGGDIVVNGSRDRAWNYVLDGIDDNETSSGGSNTSPSHQNPDMLAEFRVIVSNPTAEYGRNSGGQVLMVTRSGTNQFHGNLFEFYQSPFLQANTASNKSSTPPKPRPQFVQNIYGGSLGGPIWRDKLFFFTNVELLHAHTSSLVTRTVYTQSARNGILRYVVSPNGSIRNAPFGASTPPSVDANGNVALPSGTTLGTYDMVANDPAHIGLDPAVKAYLGLEPLPNYFKSGDGLNTAGYQFTAPATDKQVDSTIKIDYTINAHNSVYGRYSMGHQNTFADSVNGGLQEFPGLPALVNTFRQPRNLALNWRFSPTSRITNEFVAGFNRFGYAFVNPAYATSTKTPFNPNLVVAPLSSYISNNRYLTTMQVVDNFTVVRGAHIFKAGVNLRYGREIDHRGSIGALDAVPQVFFSTGNNPVSSFYNVPTTSSTCTSCINTNDISTLDSGINDLLGRIGSVAVGYVAQDLNTFKPAGSTNIMDHRWPEYDFYLQDTWHVTPRLVLDYGLRDDMRLAPRFKSFAPLVPNQDVRYGNPLSGPLQFVPGKFMDSRLDNIGPSIGFAWDPFGDGKTSVRGNYRLAFDRINSFSFSSSVFQGLPGLTYQVTDSTVGQDVTGASGFVKAGVRAANWAPPAIPTGVTPQTSTMPPAYSSNSLTVSDPHMQTPTVGMWGLSVQHELVHNVVLTVSYVGNHGTHLYGGYDSNQVEYRSNGFLDAFVAAQHGVSTPLMQQIVNSDTRHTSGQTAVQFLNKYYASNLTQNNVAGLANTFANRLQNPTAADPYGVPLAVSAGLSPTFFKPYQQYLGGMFVLQTRDYSNYNGLQMQLEKRFSQGFLVTANYTYSRAMDVRSYDPTFTTVATGSSQSAAGTPFDFHTPRLNYAPADLDDTHVINGYFVADVPFGHGRRFGANSNRIVDEVVGGWQLSGDGYWQSGRPITFFSGANTFSGSVQTPASCSGDCNGHIGSIHKENGENFWLTPAQRAQFFIPGPGQFSNIGRNHFRQGHVWQMDANLSKSFRIYREQSLQFRLEVQNVFNVVTYDTFGSQNIQSSVFTRLDAASDGVLNNSPRRAQLAAKYVF
ncbi:MAG TPA: carboxypeptidase regulatory-like domain-containing protein [Acidobacteriaceae bacterium]|nr:carboxypeptidase regulatory-like domain-containing protein [Acidobacteriaceae bacterium]